MSVTTSQTDITDKPDRHVAGADERIRRVPPWRGLLGRPEFGSIAGAVLVFVLFGIFAGDSGMFNLDGVMTWAQVAAYLGIIAVGACVLMIAGEFDLSIGSMIGFAGMMVAVPAMLAIRYRRPAAAGRCIADAAIKVELPAWQVVRCEILTYAEDEATEDEATEEP